MPAKSKIVRRFKNRLGYIRTRLSRHCEYGSLANLSRNIGEYFGCVRREAP